MKVFLKTESIASRLGDNFSLFSDVGIVSPNEVTRTQLYAGIEIDISNDEANEITITSISDPSSSEIVTIVKNAEQCVSLNINAAANQLFETPENIGYIDLDPASAQ